MSCWKCKFQDINKQDTLLGYCNWFFDFKLEDPKPIPPDIVDVGCSKFQSKVPKNASEAFNEIPGAFDNEKTTEEPDGATEDIPF